VSALDLIFKEGQSIQEFLIGNRQKFEEELLSEAVNVRGKIDEIHAIGNIDLLSNAHKLILYVVKQKEAEVTEFAEREGIAWAKYSLTLAFKLEWVQAIRRTLWKFLYQYDISVNTHTIREQFFELENKINYQIDQFLNSFFISYSSYKDQLIANQKELVDHLSFPIIPINESICVLPLIGLIDSERSSTIEEKVLIEIANRRIQTLIMDLSGVAKMETDVIQQLIKIIDGIALMGSQAVITGLRPDIVRKMVHSGLSFQDKAELKGTLQQAIKDYLLNS
jgi:rsbT co-antagonist protein RsbR